MKEIQDRSCAWNRERFPEAAIEHVALKICEEAGEVARAVLGVAGLNSATGRGDVGAEIADVFISSLVLLGRWFPEIDIYAEIDAKLTALETPGQHRGSLKLEVNE